VCAKNDRLLIRTATPDDLDILTAIHAGNFPAYWNTSTFSDFFSVQGTHAFIAERPNPVGIIVFRVQHEQADLITLAVDKEWRRLGIARRLLELAMEQAALLGAQEMFLDVEDGNVAALRLYEGYGYTHIRRRKLYYRQKDGSFTDALVMRRKLP
jgi:ribosomal-protein-alanine N-acetyltransferase